MQRTIDWAESLGRWMDEVGVGTPGLVPEVTRLQGGTQNELYRIIRGVSCVLRKPPVDSESKMTSLLRELQLLPALDGSAVPHAKYIAGTTDTDIIGTPFYLMREVSGWSPGLGWPQPYESDPSLRRELGFGLITGAAHLAMADWRGLGLATFGRPESFHDRQVDRWLAFFRTCAVRELPGMDEAAAWLRASRPRAWQPGLMHGDYHFGNVMFGYSAVPRLEAIIDWEMATIGDPLLDLGSALIAWGTEADDMRAGRHLDLSGMPSRDEMLERYEQISGRSTRDIDYYVILARWKTAIVLERTYALSVSTNTPSPAADILGVLSLDYMRKAATLARSTTVMTA